jgi:RNA polymerase sigma-70 factor (ECF subfamily)
MDLNGLIKTKRFLEETSKSIQVIIYKNFGGLPRREAEDIEQEVLLKIWKMASHGKKIRNLKSYLWRVVYTTALDIMEKRMNEISLEEYMEFSSPALSSRLNDLVTWRPKIETTELKWHMENIIESLPENRRLVLKLHLAGMDLEETAEFLRWTHHKVRHLFYRGLEDLREKIKQGKRSSEDFFKEGTNAQAKVFKKAMS